MPSLAGHGNSCDSSRSPSTFAIGFNGCARRDAAELRAAVLVGVHDHRFRAADDLDRMSLYVVRELSADEPYGHVSGRQICDWPRNARHLFRVGHLELSGGGRGERKSEKRERKRQASKKREQFAAAGLAELRILVVDSGAGAANTCVRLPRLLRLFRFPLLRRLCPTPSTSRAALHLAFTRREASSLSINSRYPLLVLSSC